MKLQQTFTTLLSLLASFASAQLLTNGNSQLPSCATGCTDLINAATACGGTATVNQQIWSCFCQSAYLKTLYTSANGVCDSVCTNPSDNQQVMTWYTSNCGTDYGAGEHPDVTTVIITTTTSSAAATVAPTSSSMAALPSTTASGGAVDPTDDEATYSGSWWSSHYKWVIMLIVIFVGLLILALVAVLLKRRHDRKADLPPSNFNAGITTRSAPMTVTNDRRGAGGDGANDSSYLSNSQAMVSGALEPGSGRNTPTRTREAFMPYGYGYARSESRLASYTDHGTGTVRGGTPVGDLEKEAGMKEAEMGDTSAETTPDGAQAKRKKRVLVRERSMRGPESPEVEEGYR